jgi:outer membrane protein TolC
MSMSQSHTHAKPLFLSLAAVAFLTLTVVCGCAGFDPTGVRFAERERFLQELFDRTAARLKDDPRITLAECIEIAELYNLDLLSARVQERIAGLDRRIAFASFLPRVDADMGLMKYQYQPEAIVGSQTVPISDRHVRERSLRLMQPVFEPYSWYMYSIFQKGEDISRLARLRTRQTIALEVTGLFFECCLLAEMQSALEAALNHARVLRNETAEQRALGLVQASDLAAADSLVQQRSFELAENTRDVRLARARLLYVLGLDPLAEIVPVHTQSLQCPEPGLEDLLLEALLTRPELAQADLLNAIAGDRARQALSSFLPSLQASLGVHYTSDSFIRFNTQTISALAGVMSVFNGFADINAYRRAREREQDESIRREQTALMIMLQVQQAYLAVQSSREFIETASGIYAARQERLREQQELRRQGLITPSEYLEARARFDKARAQLRSAYYQEQIALAILADVSGAGVNACGPDTASGPHEPLLTGK